MDLNLQGQSVTRVCFDTAFTILTSQNCELRVETGAVIQVPDGDLTSFDPESPGIAAVPLVRLTSDSIILAEVGILGNLTILFEGGAELTVAPHLEYEAWGLSARTGGE